MSADTLQQAHSLLQSYRDAGKSFQDAHTDFCDAMDDASATEGVIRGLEALERGEVTPLNAEYIQNAQKRLADKLGL